MITQRRRPAYMRDLAINRMPLLPAYQGTHSPLAFVAQLAIGAAFVLVAWAAWTMLP